MMTSYVVHIYSHAVPPLTLTFTINNAQNTFTTKSPPQTSVFDNAAPSATRPYECQWRYKLAPHHRRYPPFNLHSLLSLNPLIVTGAAIIGGAGYYYSQTTESEKAKAKAKQLEAESKQGIEKYKQDAKEKYYDAKVSASPSISLSIPT